MTLAAGTRLGPYEVGSPIGKGGMGEVYKATDTRLDRTVAIKVLPEHLAESPERKARFEREAKAISQLNHPHICTLYDVGDAGDIDYMVMEYIEGETLAERLKKGALPFAQAVEYGTQIADGLDKAHRAGIVHRDLKPANLILTKSGVKLLDFGLAKPVLDSPDSDASDAPTRQKNITKEQEIIGTLQYMSPEQLEGKPIDRRTDIWAVGAVLYEMVTGRRAFEASTSASLIAAILEHEPGPMGALNARIPPAVDRLVRICVAKDPENRWQTARDLTRELQSIADGTSEEIVFRGAGGHTHRLFWATILAALVGAVVAGLVVSSFEPTSPSVLVQRFRVVLPDDIGRDTRNEHAVSSDGRYLAIEDGEALYLRRFDTLTLERIALGNFQNLTFSPDGQWIAFHSEDQLKRIAIRGGAPTTICDADEVFGASWEANDTIVYATDEGIYRVPATGGDPELLVSTEEGEHFHGPKMLPDGRWVLYTLATGENWEQPRIVAQSSDNGERRVLVEGTDAKYAPTGHLVYAQGSTLMAAKFDAQRVELTASPVPLFDGVRRISGAWANIHKQAHFSFSNDGTLVYAPEVDLVPPMELVWVERDGSTRGATESRRAFYLPRISPDGEHVALGLYNSVADRRDVWLLDLARDALTRFTLGDANSTDAIWTRDGTHITFASDRLGSTYQVFSKPIGGVVEAEHIATVDSTVFPRLWTPDGTTLVYSDFSNNQGLSVLSADGATHALVAGGSSEMEPSLSPDGHWLTYVSSASGRDEIYVRAFVDAERQWQVSTEGGRGPLWAPDGTELFYRDGDKMMAVRVTTAPDFSPSPPVVLFEGQYTVDPFANDARNYDISPDGQRFLMVRENQVSAKADELYTVVNWFSELERLVPTKN